MFGSLLSGLGAVSSVLKPLAPVISVGGSLLGGIMGNSARSSEARENRSFQQNMSNTAYQRAMADMSAAGLNPMLAAKLGGASSPQGAMAQLQDVITPAIGAGINTMTGQASAQLNEQQAQLVDANTDKAIAELKNIPLEGDRLLRLAEMLRSQASLMSQQQLTQDAIKQVQLQTVEKIASETKLLNFDVEAAADMANVGRYTKELAPFLQLILSVMKGFK